MVFWSNDLEMTSLAYGLLLGAVAAFLTSLGLSVLASVLCTAGNARELLSAKSETVEAKVLSKQISPEHTELPRTYAGQPATVSKTFYLVSYIFDAVRQDGMVLRVEVRQRKVPSFVWEGIKEGKTVSVSFLKEEPRRCRITAAAQHESRGVFAMRARALVAFLLIVAGAVAAVLSVLDHHIAGIILYAVVVFFSLVWQLTGRRLLQAVCPCLGVAARQSPLFMHAGCVFCKELGKDATPSADPEPVVPKDVEVLSVPLLV